MGPLTILERESDRKPRGRHLPVHADELCVGMNKQGDLAPAGRDATENKRDEPRNVIVGPGRELQIGPRIDVVPGREQEDRGPSDARGQLRAIRVSLPADAAEQSAIARAESDQITTTAMIRPEDEPVVPESLKRLRDVGRGEGWAIATDRDNFCVAQRGQRLDCIFEPLREAATALRMKLRSRRR